MSDSIAIAHLNVIIKIDKKMKSIMSDSIAIAHLNVIIKIDKKMKSIMSDSITIARLILRLIIWLIFKSSSMSCLIKILKRIGVFFSTF
jgi:hypothetical protein